MKVVHTNILGADYEVQIGKRKELGLPRKLMGQCVVHLHEIKVERSKRSEFHITDEERDRRTQGVVAHEVFHAFCKESGLDIDEDTEEKLATWYEEQWRKMNNCILGVLDEIGLVDI